jgi:hypothetical protein
MLLPPKAVVISLRASQAAIVSARLEAGLAGSVGPFSHFEAVCGDQKSGMSPASFRTVHAAGASTAAATRYALFSPTRGDAISSSHRNAWQEFVNAGSDPDEIQVFFEDDAFVDAAAYASPAELAAAVGRLFSVTNADVFLLGHFSSAPLGVLLQMSGIGLQPHAPQPAANVIFPPVVTGSHAYALRRRSAAKILALGKSSPFGVLGGWETQDVFIQRHSSSRMLRTAAMCPRAVFQTSVATVCDRAAIDPGAVQSATASASAAFPRAFTRAAADLNFGDRYFSSNYVMRFAIGNVFRIEALAVTLLTAILAATAGVYGAIVATTWRGLSLRDCARAGGIFVAVMAAVLSPDLLSGDFGSAAAAVFHLGIAAVVATATAVAVSVALGGFSVRD